MKTYNGVGVQLSNNRGFGITPSAQGHIGRFNAGDVIEMQITLAQPEAGMRILLKTNRNRENATLLTERTGIPASVKYFEHQVPVIAAPAGTKFDRDDADKNCVHMVEMSSEGLVSVTNIVISAQDGEFFLVFHPTYVVQAYRGEQGIAVPFLWIEPGFSELVPFIENNYRRTSGPLPPISDYKEEGGTKPEIAEAIAKLPDENHLVVKFWSVRTGTGSALRKRSDGETELVKLYWKNLNVADRCPRHLIEGETIHAQGFRSTRSGRMSVEAIGITRVEFNEAVAS